MIDTAETWEATLQRIYWVKTALSELEPHRELGLVPNPPADPEALASAERRIGRALPPSYRTFLMRFDGWHAFFDGATLLGTKDLGKSSYSDLAQAAFDAALTPIPEGGPPSSRVRGYPGALIPFGIDPEGTTLFAFDPDRTGEDGEMSVVAWIHEIGIVKESFGDFLGSVLELCEADHDDAVIASGVDSPSPGRAGCAGDEVHLALS